MGFNANSPNTCPWAVDVYVLEVQRPISVLRVKIGSRQDRFPIMWSLILPAIPPPGVQNYLKGQWGSWKGVNTWEVARLLYHVTAMIGSHSGHMIGSLAPDQKHWLTACWESGLSTQPHPAMDPDVRWMGVESHLSCCHIFALHGRQEVEHDNMSVLMKFYF